MFAAQHPGLTISDLASLTGVSLSTASLYVTQLRASHWLTVVSTLRLGEGEGVGSIATLLTINEYEDTPEKAFLFADGDVAYFGSCVHF